MQFCWLIFLKTDECVFHTKTLQKASLNRYTLLKWGSFLTLNTTVWEGPLCWGLCLFYVISLVWWPFLSASHDLCSFLAVCLPSDEVLIDLLCVNIQELRTLSLINRSLSRSLIGADSRTHLSRSLFVDPPSPRSSWGHRGDFSARKMASSLTLLVLLQLALYSSVTCKKGEISTALPAGAMVDFPAGNSVFCANWNS